jgi:hypothetical protein
MERMSAFRVALNVNDNDRDLVIFLGVGFLLAFWDVWFDTNREV